MTTKQERLHEVYNHLRSFFGIHTQIDFAEAIRITRPALSSAMNGNEAYLTNNLFQKICAAFPGVFDLDYLLTGVGTLLINEEHTQKVAEPLTPQPEVPDYVQSLITELQESRKQNIELSAKLQTAIDGIETLKDQISMLVSTPQTTGAYPTMTVNDEGTIQFVVPDVIGHDTKSKKKLKDQLYAIVPQGYIRGVRPVITDELMKEALKAFKQPKKK